MQWVIREICGPDFSLLVRCDRGEVIAAPQAKRGAKVGSHGRAVNPGREQEPAAQVPLLLKDTERVGTAGDRHDRLMLRAEVES
jgi:hypothetical protein